MSLPGNASHVTDHEGVLGSLRRRISRAELPDPVFAALGALDIALKVPGAAGRYYGQLVEHGHSRLVEVGTERAVRKRVSRLEQTVTPLRAGGRCDCHSASDVNGAFRVNPSSIAPPERVSKTLHPDRLQVAITCM